MHSVPVLLEACIRVIGGVYACMSMEGVSVHRKSYIIMLCECLHNELCNWQLGVWCLKYLALLSAKVYTVTNTHTHTHASDYFKTTHLSE